VSPLSVDAILVITQTPDRSIPHTSALLQDKLGLREDVIAFDLGLGCSGYVAGLDVATSLAEAHSLRHVLLVTAEAYSRILRDDDRTTRPLFGDAATASLLSYRYDFEVGRVVHRTVGRLSQHLVHHGSGSLRESESGLSMNGRGILNFVLEQGPSVVENLYSQNDLQPRSSDIFFFHQANEFVVRQLQTRLNLDPSQVVVDLADVGNTSSSSIPLALARFLAGAAPEQQTRLVLVGFGVGLALAATILIPKSQDRWGASERSR